MALLRNKNEVRNILYLAVISSQYSIRR